MPKLFANEEELRTIWGRPDTREKLLEELAGQGFPLNQLEELQRIIDAGHSDLFDVLAYIAYNRSPQPRKERAAAAKPHLGAYSDPQRVFLDFVLQQYVNDGVLELGTEKLAPLLLLKYHTLADASREVGDTGTIRQLFTEFQQWLYPGAAS